MQLPPPPTLGLTESVESMQIWREVNIVVGTGGGGGAI